MSELSNLFVFVQDILTWLYMDKGTLVFPALLTPDIFPIISICPDPPLRNWEKTFGKYMDNPEEAWQTMVLERNLNTSDAIWELHKDLSYVCIKCFCGL